MIESKQWPFRPCGNKCFLRIFPVLLILLLPGVALAESRTRPVSVQAALIHDGAVVSPRHGLAYVMRPRGGVDAVDLASGKVRWHSDLGAKP